MVSDLNSYVEEKRQQITNLESQRAMIDANITESQSEIAKSNFTTSKINDLLGSDLDTDGIPDVNELPTDSTDELDIEITE